jgi:hypothetical protein
MTAPIPTPPIISHDPVVLSPSRPRDEERRRTRRLRTWLLILATFIGLWLGLSAPSVSPVAPPAPPPAGAPAIPAGGP